MKLQKSNLLFMFQNKFAKDILQHISLATEEIYCNRIYFENLFCIIITLFKTFCARLQDVTKYIFSINLGLNQNLE